MCLRGSSEVQAHALAKNPDTLVRAYVAWVPMLHGEESDVPDAMSTVGDSRARHYWDATGFLIRSYQTVLALAEPAWDVYMIYPAGVRWDGTTPPPPAFWMHQIGSPTNPRVSGPYLDAEVFSARLAETISQTTIRR